MRRPPRSALLACAAILALGVAACTTKSSPASSTASPMAKNVAAQTASAARAASTGSASSAANAGTATQPISTNTSTAPGIHLASGNVTPASQQPGSVVNVVKALTPSVVRVRTEMTQVGPFGQIIGGQAQGTGTGIIIDTQGHILTNNHVVTLGGTRVAQKITVDLSDGRSLPATLVGREPAADLAVLKINADNLHPATFADPSSVEVGEPVVAIGYALDLGSTPSVTTGVVSALNREIDETLNSGNPFAPAQVNAVGAAIQTDAAINPGNSGGPLADLNGNVIGVNTAGIFSTGSQPVQGVNFAVSLDTIIPVVKALIEKGRVDRGYLGVAIVPIDSQIASAQHLPVNYGVGIRQVIPGSPADQAGLQIGDIIVKVGNRDIRGLGDLNQATIEYPPGSKVPVEYYRGQNKQTTTITLGSQPSTG
jgi:serine protease Do